MWTGPPGNQGTMRVFHCLVVGNLLKHPHCSLVPWWTSPHVDQSTCGLVHMTSPHETTCGHV